MTRRRAPTSLLAAAAILAAGMSDAHAHAFGQRYELPIPFGFFVAGAVAAILVTFVIVGVLLGDEGDDRRRQWSLPIYRPGHDRELRWIIEALRALSFAIFVVVVVVGLYGVQDTSRNIAPTFFWVVWWIGLALVCALAGNVWPLINPWRSAARWAAAILDRVSRGRRRVLAYPQWLGAWPSVVFLVTFSWFELVFSAPAAPANVAKLLLAYSAVTWTGMLLFGSAVWLRNAEFFTVLYDLLGRFAPLAVRAVPPDVRNPEEYRLEIRPFASGLIDRTTVPLAIVAFILVSLAVVLFDGARSTPICMQFDARLAATLGIGSTLAQTLALLICCAIVLASYGSVCLVMNMVAPGPGVIGYARKFVFSLIPIAVAYQFAHYANFLLVQGQYMIPLASDPFGFGWNLFGTAGYRVDLGIVGAFTGWYMAVGAIVAGHAFGVYIAHVAAIHALRATWPVLRSQLVFTALMVIYTITSLTILAEPLVEERQEIAAAPSFEVGSVAIPPDAILPAAGSGDYRRVGAGLRADQKIVYRPMLSNFQDETPMTVADILYALSFVYRWGGVDEPGKAPRDGAIAAQSRMLRERLLAVRVVGKDTTSRTIRFSSELNLVREMPIVEIYLRGIADHDETLAPPWSTVPWHVLALMESVVDAGLAAFSAGEARQRRVAWLDVVRSAPVLKAMRQELETRLGRSAVPATLRPWADESEAKKRWAALRTFHDQHGHFLVTNGPYLLESWNESSVTLRVFRDLTYPLGVGSYDRYASPRRALIGELDVSDGRISVAVDIERTEKRQRSHVQVRERWRAAEPAMIPICNYTAVGPTGSVAHAGICQLQADGRFIIDGARWPEPGRYAVVIAISIDDNATGSDIRQVDLSIGSAATTGTSQVSVIPR